MTSRFCVIGDPIAHSLSPVMQMAAFRSAGLPATYRARHVRRDDLRDAVARLRAEGYSGFNVTIPHKAPIVPLLDGCSDEAQQLDAVNTVARLQDRLVGYNTDVQGFRDSLPVLGGDRYGLALVFGSGGAARAVVLALVGLTTHVYVLSRSPVGVGPTPLLDRAARVVGRDDPAVPELIASADLIVNATPLGMPPWGEQSPLPAGTRPGARTAVFDLVYGYDTPLLRLARRLGCPACDGLEMLVRQGAASFQRWTGLEADVDAMRLACLQALEERRTCFAS